MNPITNLEYLYQMAEDPLVMRVLPRSTVAIRALIEGLADMADGLEESAQGLSMGEPEEAEAADSSFRAQLAELVEDALGTEPMVEE